MKRLMIALLAILMAGGATGAFAHPGSGIVVDRQGFVYFVDTGSGIWRIERNGRLTRLAGPAYHWMAIDHEDRLQKATLPYFSSGGATVTRVGSDPALLLSSDFPVSVGPDGNLYYPWLAAGKTLQLFRLAPSGNTTVYRSLPTGADGKPLLWLNGIATGPDGSVYFTENRAVRKITPQGSLTTVAENIALSGCGSIPGVEADLGPYFRGIDVDAQDTVYVAATGCGAVLKITANRNVTTVLRTSSPWSPTGVAVSGSDVYVLEYSHTASDNRREWLPRVRKLAPDGRVTTVAAIDRR